MREAEAEAEDASHLGSAPGRPNEARTRASVQRPARESVARTGQKAALVEGWTAEKGGRYGSQSSAAGCVGHGDGPNCSWSDGVREYVRECKCVWLPATRQGTEDVARGDRESHRAASTILVPAHVSTQHARFKHQGSPVLRRAFYARAIIN